jgi:peptidoglycan/xylan/chitin deacetylase (PgdA/CDA1 family)
MRFLLPVMAAAAMLVPACAQETSAPRVPASTAGEVGRSTLPSVSVTPPPAAGLAPRPARGPASYNSVRTSRPVVALTFDDGPHPELTPRLLDLLRAEGVRATFYVIGRNVEKYPDIARRIVAEGHEIANHTWSHPAMPSLGAGRLSQEIRSTSEVIERVTGRRPRNLRPPYGAINDRVRRVVTGEHGMDVIMWSVDPLDWKRPGAAVVAQRLVEGAEPGGILLAHDIHPGTIEAMPATIAGLKAKGLGFVTVSQLLALEEPVAPQPPKPVSSPVGQVAERR